jgi:hypothetical protein
MRMYYIIICGLSGSTVFHIIPQTARFSKKRNLLHTKCVTDKTKLIVAFRNFMNAPKNGVKKPIGPIFKREAPPLNMGPIGCPQVLVTKCQPNPHNIPRGRRPQLRRKRRRRRGRRRGGRRRRGRRRRHSISMKCKKNL